MEKQIFFRELSIKMAGLVDKQEIMLWLSIRMADFVEKERRGEKVRRRNALEM